MRESEVIMVGKKTSLREFDSIGEFENYINTTPLNDVFRWEWLSSSNGSYGFTQTQNYQEATDLLKNGWGQMAQELEKRLQNATKEFMPQQTKRAQYDVTGFQASVPRYLQGIPTNMINQKTVVKKQKIVTFNKDISYSAMFSTEEIVKESIKALEIIKKAEAQGFRTNLNLIWGVFQGDTQFVTKIKIKSAGERLNISKVAFPLVHPSMLRRMLFRYEEVIPEVKNKAFTNGYGSPIASIDNYALQIKNEILLPTVIKSVEEVLNTLK